MPKLPGDVPRPRTKNSRDLLIAGDDGNFYKIPVEVYTQEQYLITEENDKDEVDLINSLVSKGGICAAIPERDEVAPDSQSSAAQGAVEVRALDDGSNDPQGNEAVKNACYLINLAALKWYTPFD